ncbi:MAG: hypothetical protein ABJG42_24520 [Vibrio splendidus]
MFNSDLVLDRLNDIGDLTSKKDKEALVQEFWNDDRLFRTLTKTALDPFITFGISKMPKISEHGDGSFDKSTLQLLADFRDRKLTGNAAKDSLTNELTRLSPKSAELLTRIIKGSLKAGISESTINRIYPNEIYVFKPMLAHKFSDYAHELTYPIWAEIKEDGVRGFSMTNKDYEFVSRKGLPLFGDAELRDEMRKLVELWHEYFELDDCEMVIDCEMVEQSDDFNDSVSGARRKGGSSTMMVKLIDVLTKREFDAKKSDKQYEERRKDLEAFYEHCSYILQRTRLVDRHQINSEQEAWSLFKEVKASGKEGLIVKPDNGYWEGKRSKAWLKIKGVIDVDLVVKKLVLGEEGKEFESIMGAAICDYLNSKGNIVEVRIGGGWSIEQRAQAWAYYTDTACHYKVKRDNTTVTVTVEPEDGLELVNKVIKVKGHEETKDGSIRHPRFIEIRHDKSPEDGQGS